MRDGGPAFPRSGETADCEPQDGMSLRDWFAGMAMQGLIAAGAHTPEDVTAKFTDELVASWSYSQADAMLAERERRNANQ